MVRRLLVIFSAAVVALTARVSVVRAQEPEPDVAPPAHVAFVEGTVTLERDGRPESSALNMPLLSGDRLHTADGRAEIAFADGSTLQLDAQTTVDFQSDELIRLIDGRVRVTIGGPARQVAYRIDAPVGAVRIAQPGDYRVSLLRDEAEPKLELAVIRGAAEILTDQGTTEVQAGERAYASAGLAPSYVYAYNSAQWDAFDRWSETRRNQRLGVSAQYLPESMQNYGATFDQYGDWRYAQPYGYVWYPRVAVGWRPYYHGRWVTLPSYGWTWIGADPFGWPTHHYGRWGFSSGVWFWIPGTRWGSAWVSWAYAPGYVSWCPLGWNNRPIFALGFFGGRYSPWHAWTVVPSLRFRGGFVPRHAVFVDRLATHPSFVMRQGPGVQAVAVTRSSPIRWAGTPGGTRGVAVPRSGSNYFSNGPHSASPGGPAFPAPARPPRDSQPSTAIRADRGPVRQPGTAAAIPNAVRGRPSTAVPVPGAERTRPFRPDVGTPRVGAPGAVAVERSRPPAGVTSPPVDAAQRRPFDAGQGRRTDSAPRREYAPRYDAPPGYGRSPQTAGPRYEAAPGYGRSPQPAVPRTMPRYEAAPGYGRPPEAAAPRAMPAAPYRGGGPGAMAPPSREMPSGGMPAGRPMAVPRAEPRSGGGPPASGAPAPAARPAPARGGGHRGR